MSDIIEYNGQRVLLTFQLAESYGTDVKNINDNFQNNRERYIEEKHFFELKGEELKEFKATTEISGNLKYAPLLQLWTKRGSLLHAKSLGTDQAWEAYEMLVDDYFDRVERLPVQQTQTPVTPYSIEDAVIASMQQLKQIKADVTETQQMVRDIGHVVDSEVWLTESQKAEIKGLVMSRIAGLKRLGYETAHYQGLYNALNTHFGVGKYDKIPRKDFSVACDFVRGWFPKRARESE